MVKGPLLRTQSQAIACTAPSLSLKLVCQLHREANIYYCHRKGNILPSRRQYFAIQRAIFLTPKQNMKHNPITYVKHLISTALRWRITIWWWRGWKRQLASFREEAENLSITCLEFDRSTNCQSRNVWHQPIGNHVKFNINLLAMMHWLKSTNQPIT